MTELSSVGYIQIFISCQGCRTKMNFLVKGERGVGDNMTGIS